ncbi:MAG TPA: TerC family protein [Xanthobacteraceae bacterium]|jgi:YjbE family integral membrane protein|nr:TerC family protein [Xanthobacteraceae bacterium]
MEFHQPGFWLAIFQIIWINILLSGDNAIVIAMACRLLPQRERMWGMILGAGAACALRIAFTGVVITLMSLPYLKLIGGGALLWIAYRLLVTGDDDKNVEAVESFWRAIWMITVADVVMSLDNVIAIAAAAKGSYLLLSLGLVVSIPMVIAGSAFLIALLERFPFLTWAGAALLGWIAGGLLVTDPAVAPFISANNLTWAAEFAIWGFVLDFSWVEAVCSLTGAISVLAAAHLRLRHSAKA